MTPPRLEWPDVLRGVAAFAIVLFHVRVPMWVGLRALSADPGYSSIDRAMAWMTLPFPFFGTAVMLFFVVSGFAIHYPNAGARHDFALRSYAVRRFFRIYPPYLAAVGLTLVAERVINAVSGAPMSSAATTGATAAMLQNYLPPTGQMTANPSLWSLPVEVELYVTYPLLLWLWRRVGTAAMLALVSLTSAAATVALLSGQEWPMGNFAKYWIVWVSGAVLAQWTRTNALPAWRPWHGQIAAFGIMAAVAARAAGISFGIDHFIWAGVYFLLMLWALNRPDAFRLVPAALQRSLLFLGRISYSLYLIHFPVLLALGVCWTAVFGHKPTSVVVPIVASLVPIPFAYALWRYVERPAQTWARAVAPSSRRLVAPPALPVASS